MPDNQIDPVAREVEWPGGISDGLTLPCGRCGRVPSFDYRVDDRFWRLVVPDAMRLGVVCLPCLDHLAEALGQNVSAHLEQVQWCGVGKTVVLRPEWTHHYDEALAAPEARERIQKCWACGGWDDDHAPDCPAHSGAVAEAREALREWIAEIVWDSQPIAHDMPDEGGGEVEPGVSWKDVRDSEWFDDRVFACRHAADRILALLSERPDASSNQGEDR